MTLIALAMNGLLALLLIAALALGVRLDRKLKGMKESQSIFAAAVRDLNNAAARAQTALAELRVATDEATDHLGGRIARAREVGERLERTIVRAEAAPERPAPPAPAQMGGGLDALLDHLKGQAEQPLPRIIRPPERPRPARAAFDDDLFEDLGGRA